MQIPSSRKNGWDDQRSRIENESLEATKDDNDSDNEETVPKCDKCTEESECIECIMEKALAFELDESFLSEEADDIL